MAFWAHFASLKCPMVLGEVVGGEKMKRENLKLSGIRLCMTTLASTGLLGKSWGVHLYVRQPGGASLAPPPPVPKPHLPSLLQAPPGALWLVNGRRRDPLCEVAIRELGCSLKVLWETLDSLRISWRQSQAVLREHGNTNGSWDHLDIFVKKKKNVPCSGGFVSSVLIFP